MTRGLDLRTYVVADVATILARAGRDLAAVAAVVRGAVDGGATVVQVRGKDLGGAELLDVVERCADAVAGRAALVVDDRVDVVLAARAGGARVDGVHVGQSDLPVDRVRALLGEDSIVGLSASRPHELAALRRLPAGTADYLGVGAIRATPTKPDHPEPLGWDGFAEFAALAGLPCVAIGGVGHGDAAQARRAGAAGLAVVRAVCAADDPEHAARSLRNEWAEAA